VRSGLNVSKKYDNQDDQWLGMNNNPKEWIVSYFGSKKGCLNSIKA